MTGRRRRGRCRARAARLPWGREERWNRCALAYGRSTRSRSTYVVAALFVVAARDRAHPHRLRGAQPSGRRSPRGRSAVSGLAVPPPRPAPRRGDLLGADGAPGVPRRLPDDRTPRAVRGACSCCSTRSAATPTRAASGSRCAASWSPGLHGDADRGLRLAARGLPLGAVPVRPAGARGPRRAQPRPAPGASCARRRARRAPTARSERERAVEDERGRIADELQTARGQRPERDDRAGRGRAARGGRGRHRRGPARASRDRGDRPRRARGDAPPARRAAPRRRRPELAPQPGLATARRAARAQCASAGSTWSLHVEGDAAALPTGIDLTAYRVVQHALEAADGAEAQTAAAARSATGPRSSSSQLSDDRAGGAVGAPARDARPRPPLRRPPARRAARPRRLPASGRRLPLEERRLMRRRLRGPERARLAHARPAARLRPDRAGAGRAGHPRDLDGPLWLNVLIVFAIALPLLLRRTRPCHGRCARDGRLPSWRSGSRQPPDLFIAVLMLVTAGYSTGAHAERRRERSSRSRSASVVVTIIVGALRPRRRLLPGRVLRDRALAGRAHAPQPPHAHARARREGRAARARARAGGAARDRGRAQADRARAPRRARPQPQRDGGSGVRRRAGSWSATPTRPWRWPR